MAGAAQCVSSCWGLSSRFNALSFSSSTSYSSHCKAVAFRSPSFSGRTSLNFSSSGFATIRPVQRPLRLSIVCEAAPQKKTDSAVKRARLAEKRRLYNKAKKSEMRTRMKKVLLALDKLRKKKDAQAEEVIVIEKWIAEAYSAIDKAVRSGALHRNTGARRKSRLARRKKAIEIHHGWYTPAPPPAEVTA